MDKSNNVKVGTFGARLRDWSLIGVGLCTFLCSNLFAAPIDVSSVTDIPAVVTLGEGDGSLTVKDGVMTLKGNPTKAAKYTENWNLNAVVFDYKFPKAIELPPGSIRLGYSYHRQDKSGMTYLRALISDSRGGTWAVGTKLGMRWSRTELENNFQYTESYAFDVSEVGRIDPWVMMSLDPKQHDEYDAPQPPFKWIGWRVVSDKLNGNPFNIEVKEVESSVADQTANPYWILMPERLWSLRQGAPGAYYRGNWGCGKGNSSPKLSAGNLGVPAGKYRVSWELLGLDDWNVIQSGTQNATLTDSSASIMHLPLLDAGTYNLRLAMWKDGANKPQEFFLNYTVVRNSQKADNKNRASAKKLLEWESKGAPVFAKGSKAKVALRCSAAAKVAPGAVIQYTISSADSQLLKSAESPADKSIEIDLSEWSSAEPSLLLCARLIAGKEEIDISRRVVGFASTTDTPKAANKVLSSENKMTKALKGQIYRSKGDWSEGTSPVAAQFVKALETLKPWLDEAKDTGYNVVELPAPWADLNPLPRVYQFKYLDAMIAAAKQRGLAVTLRIAPANLPPWVKKEFMQDQNGFAHGLWSGQNNLIISPSGEQMRESLFAYLRELSGHYRNEPAVVGYCFSSVFFDHDLLDEPWLGQSVDYSEASQAMFWKFLKERYDGNIGKLNQAYKTNYVQWTEIPTPRPKLVTDESGRLRPRKEAAWKDWSDHKISSIKSLRMGAVDAVREGDPDCWAGLYYSGTVAYYLDDIKARKCWITYGAMEDQFPTERAEVPGRFEPWAKITNNRTTADIGITNILMSAKPGYNGFFNYWPFEKRLNTVSPAELEAEKRLTQWFKVIDSVCGSIPANVLVDEPRGGCLVSFKGQVATLQHCSASRCDDYLRPYKFRCSSDKVRIDDIVCDQGIKLDVSRYPYIYVPYCSDNLDQFIISALTDYVEAGGRLIIESTSGFWSGDASKALQSSLGLPEVRPTGLKGTTAMEIAAWSNDTPIQSGSLSFRTQEFKPPLDTQPTAWIHNIPRAYLRSYRLCGTVPADAKIIATYADQSPAAVLIKKGKGEVIYFCGIVNWLECPGFVQALDHWGLRKTGEISAPTTPELFSATLNKGSSIYIVGRRFIGHDEILKLRNVVAKDEPGSPQKMTISVAGESLKAHSYHVRELMDGTDLGVLQSDHLKHDGLNLNLRPGQGFLLEFQAK